MTEMSREERIEWFIAAGMTRDEAVEQLDAADNWGTTYLVGDENTPVDV